MEQIPLVVIVGPTAVGKTALSIELAKEIGGEIVSGDSMQVYKKMNIGTAKPSIDEMQGIKHYLIDEIEPNEDFNVVKYVSLAHKYIKKIHKKGKIPILVGGTGLYIDSVVNNTNFAETVADNEYRNSLMELANKNGNEFVYKMLEEVDPKSAMRFHINDLRRIIRALEVYKCCKIPLSELQEGSNDSLSPYKACIFGITMDREELYKRIDRRVDDMMEKGLIDEVIKLKEMGITKSMTSFSGIGYKEIFDYLNGEISKERAIELIKQGSRRYAKRQLTWFKRNDKINWILITPYSNIKNITGNCKRYLESTNII